MLSILGSAQAIPAAVYASTNTGQDIGILTPALHAEELPHLEFENVTKPVHLRHGLIEGSELFVVVADSATLKELLHEHKTELAGKSLLLAPGGFGGSLRVRAWFEEWGLTAPRIAEVTGFIAGGRRAMGQPFRLGAAKRDLPFASPTDQMTSEMLSDYLPYFPNLVASNLVTTSLSNTNHMIHPGVVLLNAVRIENGESFRFYREGLSQGAVDLLQAIDSERLEIVAALGGEPLSLMDWMLRYYGDQGMQGDTLLECLQTFPSFANSPSPPSLKYRYLEDDVWFGVAQYLELARHVGTPTTHLHSVIAMASILSRNAKAAADEESQRLFLDYLSQG